MNTFALLLMLALGIDHSGRLVSPTEGGESTSTPSATVAEVHDAPTTTGSGVNPSEGAAPDPVSNPHGSVAGELG